MSHATLLALFMLAFLIADRAPVGAATRERTSFLQATLRPVDDAARVPDFLTFRAQLQVAIARRDLDAVMAALHPDVKLSFGGDDGIATFAPLWSPTAPDTKLWETLACVLALGGTFIDDTTFTAPYVFTQWPQDVDAFEHVAIVGSGVRVRAAPNTAAAVLDSLSFVIVPLADPSSLDEEWLPVRLPAQRIGYVHRRYARSPIDYRISFVKQGGRWRIVMFLAGD
jgi:hypothetical protein